MSAGRPSKFTPEIAAQIVKLVGEGNPYRVAAEMSGITERCLMNWLRRGRENRASGIENGGFVQFFQQIQKARAEAIAKNLKTVQTAGERSWQAAAWWLERMYPELFSLDRELLREMALDFRKRKRQERSVAGDE